MAVNLRLRPEAAEALRVESERTGVSQQEILRRAVDEHLGLTSPGGAVRWPDWVTPPDEHYRRVEPMIALPEGVDILDLIDREDRV